MTGIGGHLSPTYFYVGVGGGRLATAPGSATGINLSKMRSQLNTAIASHRRDIPGWWKGVTEGFICVGDSNVCYWILPETFFFKNIEYSTLLNIKQLVII